jgi:hypothetical protein
MTDDIAAEVLRLELAEDAAIVAAVGAALTAFEARLVREAAVMGWVQGLEDAKAGILRPPADSEAVARVVAAAARLPENFPIIAAVAQGRRPQDPDQVARASTPL